MAKRRTDIRTGVRDKLNAWPSNTTTLAEDLDATELGVDLASVVNVTEQCLLEVDSEVIIVLSVSSSTATVVRGARGTTAATHSNGATVNVYPQWGWTDAHVNRHINKAISWLGQGGVWTLVPRTNTLLVGYKEFGLPAGVTYPTGNIVKRLEILQTDGSYKQTLQWRHMGDRLFLNSVLTQSVDVRMWVETKQAELTDDSTTLDDDKILEVIELYVAGRCLEELLSNRTRYHDYSATLNDRASTLDELQRQAYFFSNQAVILRNEMHRPGLSGQAQIHAD
jgi:hypothetical protein